MCATTTKKGMSFKERLNLEKLKMKEIQSIIAYGFSIKERHKKIFEEFLLDSIVEQLKQYDWSSTKVLRTGNKNELLMSRYTFTVEIIKPIILKYIETRKCNTTPALDLNDQMFAYYGYGFGDPCGIMTPIPNVSGSFLEFLKENKIISGNDSSWIIILEPKKRRSKKESKKNGR